LKWSKVLSSIGMFAQILNKFSIPFFYLNKALTNGTCLAVNGALHKYPKVDRTEWNYLY